MSDKDRVAEALARAYEGMYDGNLLARYRSALQLIAYGPYGRTWHEQLVAAQRIAREALREEKEK